MIILTIHASHDASVSVMKDGKLIYYRVEERLSRIKHSSLVNQQLILADVKERFQNTTFDLVLVTSVFAPSQKYKTVLKNILNYVNENIDYVDYKQISTEHHLYHVYSSLYFNKLDNCCVIVLDGNGAVSSDNLIEMGSSYYIKDNKATPIIKRYCSADSNYYMSFQSWQGRIENTYITEQYKKDNTSIVISDEPGVGAMFTHRARKIGYDANDGGKLMGLAQYHNTGISTGCEMNQFIDVANFIQDNYEKGLFKFIDETLEKAPKTKNIILTGGCALNCVANSKLLEKYKEHNIYIDPVCFDAGISIGSAYYETLQKNIRQDISETDTVYVGSKIEYIPSWPELRDVKISDVAQLLADGNIVAIVQGNSEAGQRALGNRSILFNPSIPNGKDIVNKIKKRENYRPFAASILEDKTEEWFDMLGLKNSPYMQFVFKSYYPEKIPAAVHVDGTSRIQTVSIEQNRNYYNLIDEFYKITGIPMVLNTSFNLAGEPLVEDIVDVYKTFKESEIQYVYFPEFNKMLDKSKHSYDS